MLQGFFVFVLSVRLRLRLFLTFRGRPLLLFPTGFFLSFPCLVLPSFLYACLSGSQKCAWRRFLRKGESFFIGAFKQAKTYENQSGREAYFRMLCLVGFSEKNIKKPEHLPRLVKISIIDFISLRCLCLDEDSQSCNEALCSLFFPLPGE